MTRLIRGGGGDKRRKASPGTGAMAHPSASSLMSTSSWSLIRLRHAPTRYSFTKTRQGPLVCASDSHIAYVDHHRQGAHVALPVPSTPHTLHQPNAKNECLHAISSIPVLPQEHCKWQHLKLEHPRSRVIASSLWSNRTLRLPTGATAKASKLTNTLWITFKNGLCVP